MTKTNTLLLSLTTFVIAGALNPLEVMGQPPCTAVTLLNTSRCDQEWSKYKEGYERCVLDAAYHWFRQLDCKAESLEKLNRSCESCEFQFRKIQEKEEKPLIQSGGWLDPGKRALVYRGEAEKCYNIKFTRDASGDNTSFRIYVSVNDKQITSLVSGESTDVCGTKIEVRGAIYVGVWEATPIR